MRLLTKPLWRVPGGRRAFSEMKDPRQITDFAELGVSLRARNKFSSPKDMQKKMLAAVQSGKSIIARSPPGSGKSVAAALCLVKCQKTDPLKNLILVPTGSLAQQYGKLLNSLKLPGKQLYRTGKEYNDEVQHEALLAGAPTLIATPTRLLDYLNFDPSLINVENLELIVIDELDAFERKGKETGLEVLLEFILGRAPNPCLITMSSVKRPLEFRKLAKIFDEQGRQRQILDISTDWAKPRAKLTLIDPTGQPISETSSWTCTSKGATIDNYVSAFDHLWEGQGIVVVPPSVSPRELSSKISHKLKRHVLAVHEKDLAGINVPDLEHLYILGWDQSYDLEKLLRTPQGVNTTVGIALTSAQTPEDAKSLLLEAKQLN